MDLNTRIKTTSAASDHGTNSIFTSSSIFYAFFLRIKLLKCTQCLFYFHKINKILSVVKKSDLLCVRGHWNPRTGKVQCRLWSSRHIPGIQSLYS